MRKRLGLFFAEHNVRANFYHVVALAFMVTTVLWSFDFISDKASFIIGMILFATDWVAEMYDPHPDNPGPWFKTHFHKVTDDTNPNMIKWVIGVFILLIALSIVIPIFDHEEPGVKEYPGEVIQR